MRRDDAGLNERVVIGFDAGATWGPVCFLAQREARADRGACGDERDQRIDLRVGAKRPAAGRVDVDWSVELGPAVVLELEPAVVIGRAQHDLALA